MYGYQVIVVNLLVFSINAWGGFFNITQQRWVSTVNIKTHQVYKNQEEILKPKGTFQVIAELIIQDREFNLHKDCVIFRVPDEEKLGILKVLSVRVNEKCETVSSRTSNVLIKDIYNFSFKSIESGLILYIDTRIKKYSFYNILKPRKPRLNDTSATKTMFPGLSISFNDQRKGYKLEEGDICFDVSDDCQTIKEDICHLCPTAIIESVASSCQRKYRKYCRNISCGEKGAPACIRGFKAFKLLGTYCTQASNISFCRKKNKLVCEGGELLCR